MDLKQRVQQSTENNNPEENDKSAEEHGASCIFETAEDALDTSFEEMGCEELTFA